MLGQNRESQCMGEGSIRCRQHKLHSGIVDRLGLDVDPVDAQGRAYRRVLDKVDREDNILSGELVPIVPADVITQLGGVGFTRFVIGKTRRNICVKRTLGVVMIERGKHKLAGRKLGTAGRKEWIKRLNRAKRPLNIRPASSTSCCGRVTADKDLSNNTKQNHCNEDKPQHNPPPGSTQALEAAP